MMNIEKPEKQEHGEGRECGVRKKKRPFSCAEGAGRMWVYEPPQRALLSSYFLHRNPSWVLSKLPHEDIMAVSSLSKITLAKTT
jgi:hypothetical protein